MDSFRLQLNRFDTAIAIRSIQLSAYIILLLRKFKPKSLNELMMKHLEINDTLVFYQKIYIKLGVLTLFITFNLWEKIRSSITSI